ncbi:hypothetical protein SAMN05421677_109115 [Halobacillus aidingensis]|uniref:Uncharacterized protein n=1 Tax=Halobacillus aidingensis TaxID=240303 RepID=A0A1H0NM14_HALAD|nr:hypothetical protein SAMN05421677_109115 [Halobacillus aidingensis]
MLTYRTEARGVSLVARRRNRIFKRKRVLGETPQDVVRSGSGALPRKATHSPPPHPLTQKARNQAFQNPAIYFNNFLMNNQY